MPPNPILIIKPPILVFALFVGFEFRAYLGFGILGVACFFVSGLLMGWLSDDVDDG